MKPLLAPGYSWLAAVGKQSTVKMPELLAAVCIFIKKKFSDGLRKISCIKEKLELGELFRLMQSANQAEWF